jgi:hypothetical protein
MTSIWWLRWVFVLIAAALGLVLISRHILLIGVLIVAMAVARATLLLAVRKRRAAFRARRVGRYGRP